MNMSMSLLDDQSFSFITEDIVIKTVYIVIKKIHLPSMMKMK